MFSVSPVLFLRSGARVRELLLVGAVALTSACSWVAKSTEIQTQPSAVADETITEVDSYRGQAPERRDLAFSLSDDPSFLTIDSKVSSAGLQFNGPVCRIRLSDVILTTLKNSRDIRVQEFSRSIAESGVVAAQGIYDLLLTASDTYASNDAHTHYKSSMIDDVAGKSSQIRNNGLSMSLEQLLPTGGVLQLTAENSRLSSHNNPSTFGHEDGMTFGANFIQPLLRGFGPAVTNAPIKIAMLQEKMAREDFRNYVITELATAVQNYWDLVFAINNYELKNLSLKRAQELLRANQAKLDAGTVAPNVVLQAQAEVAKREADVISARSLIATAQDTLKRRMNITEGGEQWNYNLIPLDSPQFNVMDLNEEAVYQEAIAARPDYRKVLYGIEEAGVKKMVAKNNTLPNVSAVAGYEVSDSDSSTRDDFSRLEGDSEGHGYNVGLQASYYLQNRQAKAAYRQSVDTEKQQEELKRSTEERIRLEVRNAIRSLQTDLRLIGAGDSWVKAEDDKLKAELQRYEVGYTTIFEVIQFQEDLVSAQVQYLQAVINFNKSLIELQRVKASFLQDYRVEVLDKQTGQKEPIAKPTDKAAAAPTPAPATPAPVKPAPAAPEAAPALPVPPTPPALTPPAAPAEKK
jgi:outer membrane protein TolC